MRAARDQRARNYSRWQSDPVGFIETELDNALTAPQRRVAESVRDYQATVALSANAVGKTHVAAGIALWFLRAFEPAKVVTGAAPPLENLERLLWGEIESQLSGEPVAFGDARQGHLMVQMGPEWWLTGRAIPQSGSPAQREAKFSGIHSPHLLFILDEGDAVPEEVYRGIESCMSGGFVRLLIMFNPRSATGPVYRKIKNRQAHVVELDAFEHPNVIQGADVIPGAVTRAETVLRIADWSRPQAGGEDHDAGDREWFQTPAFLDGETSTRRDGTLTAPLIGGQWRKVTNPALSYMVLARFPGQAVNQLIARSWVEAAQQRWLVWRQEHGDAPPEASPVLGLDVAEFGSDRNVACLRYGGWVAPLHTWDGVDILTTADRAAKLARQSGARVAHVDATGVGSGVPPGMNRWWARHDYSGAQAHAVKVASSPAGRVEEGEFKLLRDQLWWRVREWLRTDPGAMLPPDDQLADELCAPTYHTRNGKISVSNKDELRDRLGRSPDRADALCLTFAPESTVGIRFL